MIERALTLTFGSAPNADLIYENDPNIAPIHCAITECCSRFHVQDYGSPQGTWIVFGLRHRQVIGSVVLKYGELVRIGDTIIDPSYYTNPEM